MKKSNWREDLHAPVAVKKVLKEYIQTLPLVAATSKIVPFTTTAKAIGTKVFLVLLLVNLQQELQLVMLLEQLLIGIEIDVTQVYHILVII